MTIEALENRVSALEAEMTKLKHERIPLPENPVPWWEEISGVFKDDPLFDEAERLGREWRDSQK